MSCSNNITPCGCENNPCGCKISSDDIAYQGPNLDCTGIETCDSMTVAIQKLNDYACGIDLVQNIITNITNNISLYNQFVTIVNQSIDCDTVFNCLATTTTTTTEAPIPSYCYIITATGRVTFYWIDSEGVTQSRELNDEIDYICARFDSVAFSGRGVGDFGGGVDICTNDVQCIPTTTTTTTTLNCNCVEFIIDEDDLNDATGNALPQVNNILFLDGPKDVLCSGGNLPDTFNAVEAYKYCINVDAIPLLSLYFYKDNVQQPAINSSITDTTNNCTIDGNCID
jgi:hypothetical protein